MDCICRRNSENNTGSAPLLNNGRRELVESALELDAVRAGETALLHDTLHIRQSEIGTLVVRQIRRKQDGKRANEAVSSPHRVANHHLRALHTASLHVRLCEDTHPRLHTDKRSTSSQRHDHHHVLLHGEQSVHHGILGRRRHLGEQLALGFVGKQEVNALENGVGEQQLLRRRRRVQHGSDAFHEGEDETLPLALQARRMCLMVGMGISSCSTTTRHASQIGMESICSLGNSVDDYDGFSEAVVGSRHDDDGVLSLLVDANGGDSSGNVVLHDHVLQNHAVFGQILLYLLSVGVVANDGHKTHRLLIFAELGYGNGLIRALASATRVETVPDDGFAWESQTIQTRTRTGNTGCESDQIHVGGPDDIDGSRHNGIMGFRHAVASVHFLL